jgi:hypothetical protein
MSEWPKRRKLYRGHRLYLQHQGLIPVVQELERLGWRNKGRRAKARSGAGRMFTKTSLHHLLTNVVCVGRSMMPLCGEAVLEVATTTRGAAMRGI